MTIYEIDARMAGLIDPETGELLDYEAFASLQMEREAKIENMALWYKDLTAEAKAIREEEKALAERRKSAENKAERLKGYLDEGGGELPPVESRGDRRRERSHQRTGKWRAQRLHLLHRPAGEQGGAGPPAQGRRRSPRRGAGGAQQHTGEVRIWDRSRAR